MNHLFSKYLITDHREHRLRLSWRLKLYSIIRICITSNGLMAADSDDVAKHQNDITYWDQQENQKCQILQSIESSSRTI